MSNVNDAIMMTLSGGMMLMGDMEILNKFKQEKKCIVELGTAEGRTAIFLARGGNNVTTIDTGNDEVMIEYLSRYNVKGVRSDTSTAANLFKDEAIDLLFIDGDHTYKGVKKDYLAWLQKVQLGSVIIFHDMNKTHEDVWKFYENEIQEEISKGILEELVQTTASGTVTKVFVRKK